MKESHLPHYLMESLQEAIRTAPTVEEAERRREYETSVGFSQGDRIMYNNKDGRVIEAPQEPSENDKNVLKRTRESD